jgi:hypothetical protein
MGNKEAMNQFRLPLRLGKVCALVAATLVIPVLAHAQATAVRPSAPRPVPVVPEANPGLVLIPFMGAVLLFSARHIFRAKAAGKSGC